MTDLGMPYVDGRQVCAAVKTGAPDTNVVQVDSVLSKPPKLLKLRETLARALHAAQPSPH